MTGDPNRPPFPKEVWLQQVNPGEYAVRYKDFKTGLARNPEGKHVSSSEKCRVFRTIEEARANSLEIVNAHPGVICLLHDHTGAQIDRVSNRKVLSKFAVTVYVGILLWGSIYALAGMVSLWLLYRGALFLLKLWLPGLRPIHSLPWIGWVLFAATGLLTSIAAWLLRIQRVAAKRVRKVHSSFSEEEMKRFAGVNSLYGTADPAKRERLLELSREFQQRVREALKK